MVTTSFTAAALVVLTSGSASTVPAWQKDYARAMAVAVAQQKPMAVFIGHGEAGYAKLVAGGQIPAAANTVLNSQYVAVYVNTETAAGKELAGAFEMQSGLVISTRGGEKQALRHAGSVAATELTGLLTAYSNTTVARPVVTTAAPVTGYVTPASYTAPVMNYAPTYRPSFGGYSVPVRGGCANGRCGR
jgi:hypothetical protein